MQTWQPCNFSLSKTRTNLINYKLLPQLIQLIKQVAIYRRATHVQLAEVLGLVLLQISGIEHEWFVLSLNGLFSAPANKMKPAVAVCLD